MKRVALVGFGFMGRTHYGAWKKCRGAKVVAVCVTNLAHLSAKVEGNIAGVADNARLPKGSASTTTSRGSSGTAASTSSTSRRRPRFTPT